MKKEFRVLIEDQRQAKKPFTSDELTEANIIRAFELNDTDEFEALGVVDVEAAHHDYAYELKRLSIEELLRFAEMIEGIDNIEEAVSRLDDPESIGIPYWVEFDEDFYATYFDGDPYGAARATFFGDVNWNDGYAYVNDLGNIRTRHEPDYTDFEGEILAQLVADYNW